MGKLGSMPNKVSQVNIQQPSKALSERLFQNLKLQPMELLLVVKKKVTNKLMSLRNSSKFQFLM